MTRRWLVERRKEYYYRRAKKENLRSRAAFKILQLNEKFSIIKSGDRVLDLGSAPGGWVKAIKKIVGEEGLVVGVDIQAMSPVEGVKFIIADITSEDVVDKIKEYCSKFDAVTSDCSPNVSGNWGLDHARQIFLAEKALDICESLLRSKGNFVVKVFQGEYFQEYLKKMKMKFEKVIITKPAASRKKSSEVYLIGKSFRG
ncbi:MAG: RlmE family RNA methyltransferase [Candidatus Odinarchaeia archaeon]